MIELKCICNKQDEEFKMIKPLYEETFPITERREVSKLADMIGHNRMSLKAIKKEDEVVGLLIYWNFETFLFIEHFAIFPRERSKNIGFEVLSYLKRVKNRPIVLEVELVKDDISRRRVEFYNRLGFNYLKYEYMQPSYDGINPPLKMNLMSNVVLSNSEVSEMVNTIEREVYLVNY